MPVLTGPACNNADECPVSPFPTASSLCVPLTSAGGVNDLYFIPCSEEMTEANITDTAWWEALLSGGSGGSSLLGNVGAGLGSIAKLSDIRERISSCKPEQIISATWGLTYVLKTFDKSSEKTTHDQVSSLFDSAPRYQLIARMCDGENTVLPIGVVSLNDFNWTVPDNSEALQTITLVLSWVEKGLPRTYEVAGLSAVVPKAA